ncbi:hypothetical protein [Methylophilus luteus]|uniref:MxaK protein n=1 Tax=Methylophilus luteus TaxID=640108 RepID=A0ABW3F849_9PROT
MHSVYARSDRSLLAVLAGGLLLMILPALQHVFWAAQTQVLDQPAPHFTSNIAAMLSLPAINMQAKNADTLFKPAKQQPPSPQQQAQTEYIPAKAAVAYTRPWQLQILRPPLAALMRGKIADGYQHLRSGQLALARQAFLTALTRDTHSVEAMQGMLLLARQAGDSQSEADYLERLRLEIPYYEHDPESASQADSDQGQS